MKGVNPGPESKPDSPVSEGPTAADFKRMPLWEPPKSAADWGSYISLACGLAMILFMVYLVWSHYVPLLWVDQWSFLRELIGNHGQYSFSLLWKQHNDHRIVIPKLFYLVDLFLFHGTNTFLLVVIFCIQLAHLAWLAAIYVKIGRLSSAAWRTAVGLTAICLFAPRQIENFFFGSDLPLVLILLCATVALSSLGLFSMSLTGTKDGKLRYLVLCWAAAAVAVLSFSSGLLLWPLLVLLGVVWRLPRKWIVITAALGASFIGVMMVGYTNSILTSSSIPILSLLRYLLLLYGSSWSFVSDSFGMVLAAPAIPAAAVVCVWVLIRRRADTFAVVLISLIGFILAGSFATALGRIQMGIDQARADRYQTGILLFWCCLAVLLIRQASRARRNQVWLLTQQAVIVLIVVCAGRVASPLAEGLRSYQESMKRAAAAIEAGVKDSPTVLYPLTAPHNQDLIVYGNYLRSRGWSLFAKSEPYQLGRKFDRYYRVVSSSMCGGAIDSVAAVPDNLWPGIRISGWAWDIEARAPGRAVVLTDSSGRLICAARTGFWRPDVPMVIPAFNADDSGYIGYVPADLQSSSAEAFVILADNKSACPLSGQSLVLDSVSTAYSGPAPTGVTRHMVGYRLYARGHIDTVNGNSTAGKQQPFTINRDEPLKIGGWIVDPKLRCGAAADVLVDGVPLAIHYGLERPDVAKALGSADALHGGYLASVAKLSPGVHSIAIRVVSRDEDLFYEGPEVRILVQ